jgi:hypothetical protein
MKTLLSTVAALAVMTVAGAALAQDAPADDSSAAPAKHHHAKHHKAMDAADKSDDSAEMKGRTEHGGPPSSSKEKAETEKLNDQQLGGSH